VTRDAVTEDGDLGNAAMVVRAGRGRPREDQALADVDQTAADADQEISGIDQAASDSD